MRLMGTKPIPVRIPVEFLDRLKTAAKRLGTNRSQLIAFCAQTFLEEFERKGIAMMPPNWEHLLNRLDGRRKTLIIDTFPGPSSPFMANDDSISSSSPPYGSRKKK